MLSYSYVHRGFDVAKVDSPVYRGIRLWKSLGECHANVKMALNDIFQMT